MTITPATNDHLRELGLLRISVNQLSQETGVSVVTLRRQIKRGKLKAVRKGGNQVGGGKYYITEANAKLWAEGYFAE